MDSLGWVGLEPAPCRNENSSLGLSIPYSKLGRVPAHPNEAMNSIKRLKMTGAAILVFRVSMSLQAAPAA
jgi:hypothetical protein